MMKMFNNKKGIGFGRLLVILVFVLLGLTLVILTITNQKVSSSIGSNETNQIDRRNADFYFLDSMKLGFSDSLNKGAQDSFINPENGHCVLHPDGETNVLNENCKPDMIFLNKNLAEETASYVSGSLKKFFGSDVEVVCTIDQGILQCESSDVYLNASRKNDFFSYNISSKFKLKNSFKIDYAGLNDLDNIYNKATLCNDVASCTITSDFWDLKNIEESQGFFIFSFETKKEYAFVDGLRKIDWKFAIKQSA